MISVDAIVAAMVSILMRCCCVAVCCPAEREAVMVRMCVVALVVDAGVL